MAPRRIVTWITSILAILFLLTCAGLVFPLQTIFYLSIGWVSFIRRVAPQISIDGWGVATAALSLGAVGLIGHWFLRWLNAKRAEQLDQPSQSWRCSWTVGILSATILMFTSGICVVGVAHQTAWLLISKEPVVQSTFEAAFRGQSINNLKQIGFGLARCEEKMHSLPAGATFDQEGRPQHGWQTHLLPYLGYERLYDEIDHSLPWDARENREAFRQQVPAYVHPKDWSRGETRVYAISSYAANAYLLGGARRWTPDEITDGGAQTILCGEATTQPRPWGDPINWRDPAPGIRHTATSFGGPFANVTQFAFVDGHATAISNKIDPEVLRALCTPASGDRIGDDADY